MQERWERLFDDESKLKVTRTETPEGVKFSVVYLLFLDGWRDIARIDNYPHEGKTATHIHRFDEERVEFREMDLYEAIETITRIGNHIKERIKHGNHRIG